MAKEISYAESVRLAHEYIVEQLGEGQQMVGGHVISKLR
jgi:hypothetical protein